MHAKKFNLLYDELWHDICVRESDLKVFTKQSFIFKQNLEQGSWEYISICFHLHSSGSNKNRPTLK